MPVLRCTAVNCVYNKEQLCSRGDIHVSGEHAREMDETACESFKEHCGDAYADECGCGCETIEVSCSARTCRYNEDRYCRADAIDINGSYACTCAETCCGTFQCK